MVCGDEYKHGYSFRVRERELMLEALSKDMTVLMTIRTSDCSIKVS